MTERKRKACRAAVMVGQFGLMVCLIKFAGSGEYLYAGLTLVAIVISTDVHRCFLPADYHTGALRF